MPTDTLFVPMVKLNELCNRALRYRQGKVADDPRPGRRQGVRYSVPFRSLKPGEDGWVHISNLIDDYEGVYFAIWWHPESDRLRLQGPKT